MSGGLRMSMNHEIDPIPQEPEGGDEIPRSETGLRILLTILFVLIAGVLETVLAVLVLFELGVALVTQRAPSDRVRELANRIISYYYRLGRYMTYNESRVPFPFDDFPEPVEPDAFDPEDSESKALGIRSRANGIDEPEPEEDEEDRY